MVCVSVIPWLLFVVAEKLCTLCGSLASTNTCTWLTAFTSWASRCLTASLYIGRLETNFWPTATHLLFYQDPMLAVPPSSLWSFIRYVHLRPRVSVALVDLAWGLHEKVNVVALSYCLIDERSETHCRRAINLQHGLGRCYAPKAREISGKHRNLYGLLTLDESVHFIVLPSRAFSNMEIVLSL